MPRHDVAGRAWRRRRHHVTHGLRSATPHGSTLCPSNWPTMSPASLVCNPVSTGACVCVCVAERPWVCGMTGNAEGNHLDLCFRAFVELHTFEVGTPPRGRVRETWVTRHLMLHLPRFKGSRGSLP